MSDDDELYVDSLSCRFGAKMVLSGVYLRCKPGEVLGLLGRNGAGKSTLLKVIFGQYQGLYKHCTLDGSIYKKGYLTREIAYLPQEYLIPGDLKLQAVLSFMPVSKYRDALMEIPLIREHLRHRLGTLSGGIRRMIEALMIIYSDARYVLLDEPFSNLAPAYIDELHTHIRKLKAGKGFVITDHYYTRVLEISDHTLLIHNGSNYRINGLEDLYVHGYIPESAL